MDGELLFIYAILKQKIRSMGLTQEQIDEYIKEYLERNPIQKFSYDSITRTIK